MINRIEYLDYISSLLGTPIIDVRSPSEYIHAHIPCAYNLPLFTDEERCIVGTAYKKESKEKAIKIGLDLFGPKMRPMVEEVEQLLGHNKKVVVHCWRGGMRSGVIAWLLDLYGFEIYTLTGGYKAYRNLVLDTFTKTYKLHRIGGYTGAGKTKKLAILHKDGNQAIDLEELAQHKGSAFGHLGMLNQPSQEMFENKLAQALMRMDHNQVIYIEDESIRLGHVAIPKSFYTSMRASTIDKIEASFENRLNNIITEYGHLDTKDIIDAIYRIKKKLGGLEAQNAINFILQGDIKSAFTILLHYYDRAYDHAAQK
jgi:tRNA 2-selenouridine synthase